MKKSKAISLVILAVLFLVTSVMKLTVTEVKAEDEYDTLLYEIVDSKDIIDEAPDYSAPFISTEQNEMIDKIYKVEVPEAGLLYFSEYSSDKSSINNNGNFTSMYVYTSKTMINTVEPQRYDDFVTLTGEKYKINRQRAYHLIPGTYYVKIKQDSRYRAHMLFAFFVKDATVLGEPVISYDDEHTCANIRYPHAEKFFDTYRIINGTAAKLSDVSTDAKMNVYSQDKGLEITENGTYTVTFKFTFSYDYAFNYKECSSTFTIDKIGQPEEEIVPESVTLSATKATLSIGEKLKLTATVLPEDAENKTVTWKSSNKAVATVSSKGTVTAKGEGTCRITVKASNGKSAKCTVTVKGDEIPATGIKLNVTKLNMHVGDKYTLKVKFTPADTTDQTVTWATSKKSVATVSSKGVVTAKSKGTVTISAKTVNGLVAKVRITVTPKDED